MPRFSEIYSKSKLLIDQLAIHSIDSFWDNLCKSFRNRCNLWK